MKNILRSVIALTLFAGFWSCEDEQDLKFVSPDASFAILTPQSGDGVVLDQVNPGNPGLVLSWEDMDYGTPTEVTYSIQIDKNGNDFATPVTIGTTTNTFISIDASTLNGAALGVGLDPFVEGAIDVRIMSTVGSMAVESAYSNVINYLVTPYSSELPKLYVVGNFQGASGYGSDWTPATGAPLAAASFDSSEYEGYVYMNVPTANYLILPTNESFDGKFGDDGSFSGILVNNGGSDIVATGPSLFRIRADIGALTYTTAPVSWGIIGAATPGGWDADTDLTYNTTTHKLEIASIALVPGAFKFRGNDAWSNGFDFGTVNTDGYLVEGGDLTFDGPAGNYKVILDLSNPRKYTYEFIAL